MQEPLVTSRGRSYVNVSDIPSWAVGVLHTPTRRSVSWRSVAWIREWQRPIVTKGQCMIEPAVKGSDPGKHLRQMNDSPDVLNGFLCQFCDVGSTLFPPRCLTSAHGLRVGRCQEGICPWSGVVPGITAHVAAANPNHASSTQKSCRENLWSLLCGS